MLSSFIFGATPRSIKTSGQSKLLLALTAYLDKPWFCQDCNIYKTFNDIIIKPLCRILGVDQAKKEEAGNCMSLKVTKIK